MSRLPYGGMPPTPVFFDIETGPLSLEEVEAVAPKFNPGKHVKYGNVKDPEKRAAIAAKAEEEWVPKLRETGGLNAEYGRVLLVSALFDDEPRFYEGEEGQLISQLWDDLDVYRRGKPAVYVNHNIKNFDLPFLIRRSWVHDITVPTCVSPLGRYWPNEVIDTMDIWACTEFKKFISLDQLGRLLGLGGKNGSGENFADLYAEDPEAAKQYCLRDVELARDIYNRLGGERYVSFDE